MKATRQDIARVMEETFDTILSLNQTKGEEYSTADDALLNFNRDASDNGMTQEPVLRLSAGKHWQSVTDYVRDVERGKMRNRTEPIEARIDDLIVYLCILKVMVRIRDRERQKT